MNIQLSDHFTYKKLLSFTAPPIIMMVFTSIYSIVDGFFVSNYIGKTPLAAVNFIYPLLMLISAIGFMFGTGGSALIGKTLGEGKKEKANSMFSLFVYITIVLSVIVSLLCFIFLEDIATLLGAEGEMLEQAVLYGRTLLISLPFLMLQFEFQSFFVTAEKPQLGLVMTVIAGVCNMVLDWLFIAVFEWGIMGAAVATATSQFAGGIMALLYFCFNKTSLLKLGKTRFDGRAVVKACTNGSSELLSNISMSLVSMLFNIQLLKYAGEDGVAAYGVLMYINLIFLSIFIGYVTGVAPVVSYHFGANNTSELKNLRRKSILIMSVSSLLMFVAGEIFGPILAKVYVGYDTALLDMTIRAFMIYSFAFLFSGIAIFGSAFFTALNDGLTSAVISTLRTLIFEVASVLIMPLIFDIDGIWLSIVTAEFLAFIVTIIYLIVKKKKYNY
ncbi:MAG: MATE family efflux transporter [Clostridia bacterium]|nr:MATE family efflux transporter [Clostridia bacterium]